MLFCHITSRVTEDKHQNLLSEKGGRGFPHLVFMDADGAVLAVHKGNRTAAGFAETGRKAKAFQELKAKAEKEPDNVGVQFEFLKVQIELGMVTAAQARDRMAKLKLSPDQTKKLEDCLVDLDVMEIVKGLGRDKAAKLAAGKKFADWKKSGRTPKGDDAVGTFYSLIMDYAEEQKDAGLFEEAFNAVKTHFGDRIGKNWANVQEQRLAKLKGK